MLFRSLYAEFGDSRITTYAVDIERMAQTTLEVLLRRITDGTADARVHVVSGRLVERKSVKRIN